MKYVLICLAILFQSASCAQLVLNEFSNGTSGSKEFYELVTVGTPGTTVDIRNWMIDDHSGFYGCGSGNGIAAGHVRFSNNNQWKCVPTGSIIVIYNPSDKNSSITQLDDYTDINQDGVYILPINAINYLEADLSFPTSASCNNFGTGYTTATNWQPLALGNSADVAQIMNPANTTAPHHAVGYGSLSGPNPPIYFAGNGGGTNYSFVNTVNNIWNTQANWVSQSAGTADSPGLPNNSSNANWINGMRLNITADTIQGCAPLLVQFTSNAAAQTGTTLSWDFGDGFSSAATNDTHTYTNGGTYNAVFEVSNTLGCTLSDTIVISVSTSSGVVPPTLADVCANIDSLALPLPSVNHSWSGTFVYGNVFLASAAGTGVHNLTYSLSGACGGSVPVTINVQPAPVTSLNLVDTLFCVSGTAVPLSGGTPVAGTYFGAGVTGTTFNPALASVGNHLIGYAVSNMFGCTDTAFQQVTVINEPSINWSLPDTLCTNTGNMNIKTATPVGGTYTFQGMPVNTPYLDVSLLLPNQSYQINYQVGPASCQSSGTQSFYLLDTPSVQIAANAVFPVCRGQTVELSGSTSGLWNTGVTGLKITTNTGGLYTLSVSNACGNSVDSINVSFIDSPLLELNVLDTTICKGESALLTAMSNQTVIWNTGDTSYTLLAFSAGLYTATAENECGKQIQSVKVNVDTTSARINLKEDGFRTYILDALPADLRDVEWYINNDLWYSEKPVTHVFESGTSFDVRLEGVTSNGCAVSTTYLLELPANDLLFIPNVFTPNGDGLNDVYKIVGEVSEGFHAEVYNRWGNKVASWQSTQDFWDGTYNGVPCQDGVYIIKVTHQGETHTRSIHLLNRR